MTTIFIDANDNAVTKKDITDAIKKVGANNCKYLFMHSDISFGKPAPGMTRRKIFSEVYDAIASAIGNTQLIVPTFSYSFCNGEDYDVEKSKTSMGALNEYIRRLSNRYRTNDPLLSVSVPNELKEYFDKECENSLGECSALDTIHKLKDVKFLFFGVRMGAGFTYLHYIEKMLDVPYRYDQVFTGNIINADTKYSKTQSIHTACYGVKPAEFFYFEEELENKGLLKKVPLGNLEVSCVSEKDVYKEIVDRITNNVNYFLEKPFEESDLIHKYTMGEDGKRITHC